MIKASKIASTLAAMVLLAACSSVPYGQRLSDRQAAYAAAAGAPISSFHFFQSFWSWEPLGTDQVAVYTQPHKAYLLDVPGCTDLPFANSIGVTSSLNEVQCPLRQGDHAAQFRPLHHHADPARGRQTPQGVAADAAQDRGRAQGGGEEQPGLSTRERRPGLLRATRGVERAPSFRLSAGKAFR